MRHWAFVAVACVLAAPRARGAGGDALELGYRGRSTGTVLHITFRTQADQRAGRAGVVYPRDELVSIQLAAGEDTVELTTGEKLQGRVATVSFKSADPNPREALYRREMIRSMALESLAGEETTLEGLTGIQKRALVKNRSLCATYKERAKAEAAEAAKTANSFRLAELTATIKGIERSIQQKVQRRNSARTRAQRQAIEQTDGLAADHEALKRAKLEAAKVKTAVADEEQRLAAKVADMAARVDAVHDAARKDILANKVPTDIELTAGYDAVVTVIVYEPPDAPKEKKGPPAPPKKAPEPKKE
ncbi:MAG: hypothetical protein FJ291_32265 [Planctomycetes bacterium]|nr:hypothetical protein [Planctomycetota bacterium]